MFLLATAAVGPVPLAEFEVAELEFSAPGKATRHSGGPVVILF